MASYELLDAANTKGIRTTADVALALDIPEQAARLELREAERAGLVPEELDESTNVPPDFERRFWHLTSAGFHEWDWLEAERAAEP